MSLKCPVFRTSSCEWTYYNGIYTTLYSNALKFLSMAVVLRVFASDVVETLPSETETWLKFRDETETLS